PSGQQITGVDFSTGEGVQNPVFVDLINFAASDKTYFGKPLTAHVSTLSVMRAKWITIADDQEQRYYNKLVDANATECGIDVCVIKYNATELNSKFTETIVDTFINETDRQV